METHNAMVRLSSPDRTHYRFNLELRLLLYATIENEVGKIVSATKFPFFNPKVLLPWGFRFSRSYSVCSARVLGMETLTSTSVALHIEPELFYVWQTYLRSSTYFSLTFVTQISIFPTLSLFGISRKFQQNRNLHIFLNLPCKWHLSATD